MAEKIEKPYRVGIIGGGRQGTVHAREYHLNSSTEVVAVADTDPDNLDLFCQRFNCAGYASYEEMLTKERIDIAAPVLPVSINADAVIASAHAGVRAVSCEKPLTASLKDADRMVDECRSRNVLFAAGLVPRNYSQHWKAREMIEAGEIGSVRSINVYDSNGQGGCHGVNMALHFAGDAEVDWLVGTVDGDPLSDGDPGDSSFDYKAAGGIGGYIRFKNGIDCFSHRAQTPKHGIEVVGEQGIFFSDFFTTFRIWKNKGSKLKEVKGAFPAPSPRANPDGSRIRDDEGWIVSTDGMRDTVQALVVALDTGKIPKLTTGADLQRCLEICIALRESHRKGFETVRLPLENRNLTLYPIPMRWSYKKDEMNADWYAEQMAQFHQA